MTPTQSLRVPSPPLGTREPLGEETDIARSSSNQDDENQLCAGDTRSEMAGRGARESPPARPLRKEMRCERWVTGGTKVSAILG